ncbi:MAG TPA: DUF1893 domain-containing protein [Anaerolineaceae bacterium]|nr:DUF1893 domain-containing protein [Anaerolineaceae bacterium]
MGFKLSQNVSLQLFYKGKVVFQSKSHWIMPLFELEDHLKEHPVDLALAEVHDKVVGKAAAMLILRLGIGRVFGNVMSELADATLSQAEVPHFYHELVDRIDCKTEELLLEVDDKDAAYEMLCKLARRC